nr:MAG TPA: hypothetical protein [Caudoviricetes sp.]
MEILITYIFQAWSILMTDTGNTYDRHRICWDTWLMVYSILLLI